MIIIIIITIITIITIIIIIIIIMVIIMRRDLMLLVFMQTYIHNVSRMNMYYIEFKWSVIFCESVSFHLLSLFFFLHARNL